MTGKVIPIDRHQEWNARASLLRRKAAQERSVAQSGHASQQKLLCVDEVFAQDLSFYNVSERARQTIRRAWKRGCDWSDQISRESGITLEDSKTRVNIELFQETKLQSMCEQINDSNRAMWKEKPHYFIALAHVFDKRLERILTQVHLG